MQYVNHDKGDWLGAEDAPLSGFSWRGGSERDTTGILMWSEPFLHQTANGQKLAVLLLDTQVCFSNKVCMKNSYFLFLFLVVISLYTYSIFERILYLIIKVI